LLNGIYVTGFLKENIFKTAGVEIRNQNEIKVDAHSAGKLLLQFHLRHKLLYFFGIDSNLMRTNKIGYSFFG
jgi:hypothetical protein